MNIYDVPSDNQAVQATAKAIAAMFSPALTFVGDDEVTDGPFSFPTHTVNFSQEGKPGPKKLGAGQLVIWPDVAVTDLVEAGYTRKEGA